MNHVNLTIAMVTKITTQRITADKIRWQKVQEEKEDKGKVGKEYSTIKTWSIRTRLDPTSARTIPKKEQ